MAEHWGLVLLQRLRTRATSLCGYQGDKDPQSPTQGAMNILETHLCTASSLAETHFKRRTVKCQAEVVRRASSLPWMPGDPQKDAISLEREFLAESLLSTVLKFLDFKMRWHLLNPIMYSCGPDVFRPIGPSIKVLSKEARNQI